MWLAAIAMPVRCLGSAPLSALHIFDKLNLISQCFYYSIENIFSVYKNLFMYWLYFVVNVATGLTSVRNLSRKKVTPVNKLSPADHFRKNSYRFAQGFAALRLLKKMIERRRCKFSNSQALKTFLSKKSIASVALIFWQLIFWTFIRTSIQCFYFYIQTNKQRLLISD